MVTSPIRHALVLRHLVTGRVLTPAERAAARMVALVRAQREIDGVFAGGGALGAAYIGALRFLHDNGLWFRRVAGNSAGAITACMLAAGFNAHEIQWLTTAVDDRDPAPDSLSRLGITQPVRFSDFLDLPTLADVRKIRRRTQLWHLLNGSLINEIGKIELEDFPTRTGATNAVMAGILNHGVLGPLVAGAGAAPVLRKVVRAALVALPASAPSIGDLVPAIGASESLRTVLADTLWEEMAKRDRLLVLTTHLVHEAAIFKGDQALTVLRELLARKVLRWNGQGQAPAVAFGELPIPLAVLATDIRKGRMVVYSSQDTPLQDVGEAVRQSMGLPIVFKPRGPKGRFVDGGLCSNYPAWLFSKAGDRYWPPASVGTRLKVGFTLDGHLAPPTATNPGPGRFSASEGVATVLADVLIEKLVDEGAPRAAITRAVDAALGLATTESDLPGLPTLPVIDIAVNTLFNGMLNTEQAVRPFIQQQIMAGTEFIDVALPMSGFSLLDFYVNEDEAALVEMWDRAWKASAAAFQNAPPTPTLALLRQLKVQSPFE